MTKKLLFLCVANSARSQMAEGLARHVVGDRFEVFSAGSKPSTVHPMANRVMAEIDMPLDGHRSKGLEDVPMQDIDTVFVLCAEEECPVMPASVQVAAWPFPDPAGPGDDATLMQSFRTTRDAIRARLVAEFGEDGGDD